MNKPRIFTTLLVFMLIGISCKKDEHDPDNDNLLTAPLLPLKTGNWWIYDVTDSTITRVPTQAQKRNGGTQEPLDSTISVLIAKHKYQWVVGEEVYIDGERFYVVSEFDVTQPSNPIGKDVSYWSNVGGRIRTVAPQAVQWKKGNSGNLKAGSTAFKYFDAAIDHEPPTPQPSSTFVNTSYKHTKPFAYLNSSFTTTMSYDKTTKQYRYFGVDTGYTSISTEYRRSEKSSGTSSHIQDDISKSDMILQKFRLN